MRLYLCGPKEVAEQVLAVLQPVGARVIPLEVEQREDWTHRIHVDGQISDDARRTIKLLERVLSLVEKPPLDWAIALDFYKDPDSHEDPMKWKDTSAGTMVNIAKYHGHPEAFDDLAASIADVITEHKILTGADYIVAVPGHDTRRTSFGKRLAAAVASRVGKPLIEPAN